MVFSTCEAAIAKGCALDAATRSLLAQYDQLNRNRQHVVFLCRGCNLPRGSSHYPVRKTLAKTG